MRLGTRPLVNVGRRIGLACVLVATLASCGGGDTKTQDASQSSPTTSDQLVEQATPTTVPQEGAGTDVADGSATPSTTAPAATTSPASVDLFAPPPGTYTYDVSGFTRSGDGATARERRFPPREQDDVSVQRDGDVLQVHTVTTADGEGPKETDFTVTEREAHLTRLSGPVGPGGAGGTQALTPDPPILAARLPYEIGDQWDVAWSDDATGLEGVGSGSVLRTESVTTGRGALDTVVIEIQQRIAGAVNGQIVITLWIDPRSGVQAKRSYVSDLRGPTGATHSESTSVLVDGPMT